MRHLHIMLCMLLSIASRAAEPVFSNDDVTATVIEPGVTVLETSDKTTMYLVEGDTAALLIDTGTKCRDLDKIAAKLTDKPLRVALTHCHYDHSGGVHYFPEGYMHPADTLVTSRNMADYKGKIRYIEEGYRFELGSRTLEVFLMPGHTPGSIIFVDFAGKMAFTGDAFGTGQLWMQLNPQVEFSTLSESCVRMLWLLTSKYIEKLYAGHYPYIKKPIGLDYMLDIAENARDIENGNINAATPFGEDALLLRRGQAEIVFRPEAAGKRKGHGPTVLLKLDDVHYGDDGEAVPDAWNRVVNFIDSAGIKANLGIIGYSLDSDRTDYFDWLRTTARNPRIEFWNHGYHNRMSMDEPGEFEQDFHKQRAALHRTDSLATAKAGLTLRAWGRHWTNCNEHTDSALASISNIELVFGHPEHPRLFKGTLVERNLEMEYPFHNPVYAKFLANYLGRYSHLDHFYLQGHPHSWDEARWQEFTAIIRRLKADGAHFVCISEFLGQQ